MKELEQLKFDSNGLIPAIIQEQSSGRVLMMAWMNEESLRKTIETRQTWFWSRSRKTFWMKGETSGHIQRVKDVAFDCDGDVVLIQVEQVGAACHEGYKSCFYRSFRGNDIMVTESKLVEPETVYGKKNDRAPRTT
jgi:phosphoribosyl-AMP cyclohydrolase